MNEKPEHTGDPLYIPVDGFMLLLSVGCSNMPRNAETFLAKGERRLRVDVNNAGFIVFT